MILILVLLVETTNLAMNNDHLLMNLDPMTTYIVRVATRTTAGPGQFSQGKKATTSDSMTTSSAVGSNVVQPRHQWAVMVLMAALLAVNICF